MAFIICLAAFWGCEDNNDKFHFQEPTEFKLNTPPYTSGIYDLINTETIELTCSQPDYGFTAAIVYRVHVSIDPNFPDSTTTTLNTAYTTAKMDVDAKEIAVALVEEQSKVMTIESEEDYPTDPFPVYIKLSAELTNGMGLIYSNAITLPNVKGYYALEDPELPTSLYMIGSMTGWDSWNDAFEMIPVYSGPGEFWRIVFFPDNATFKLNTAKEWDGNDVGYNEATFSEETIAYAGLEEEEGNIKVTNGGWYLVYVKVSIDERNYNYDIDFLEPNIYLFGRANSVDGIWDADPSILFTVPDISLGADAEFISPVFARDVLASEDGVRACIILSGHEWWHTEFIVFDGVLEYRGTGDDQDRVVGKAGERLYINFTKGTGKIE